MKGVLTRILLVLGAAFVVCLIAIGVFVLGIWWNFNDGYDVTWKNGQANIAMEIKSEREALLYVDAIKFYPYEKMADLSEGLQGVNKQGHLDDWKAYAKQDGELWKIKFKTKIIPSMTCLGVISKTGKIVQPFSCRPNK